MNYAVVFYTYNKDEQEMGAIGPFDSKEDAFNFAKTYGDEWSGWNVVEITNPDSWD